jgi:hypothetical protein
VVDEAEFTRTWQISFFFFVAVQEEDSLEEQDEESTAQRPTDGAASFGPKI